MSKKIYLVWASRGDYSDHREYAVCWYVTEKTAKEHAEAMNEASEEWRRRVASVDYPKRHLRTGTQKQNMQDAAAKGRLRGQQKAIHG